MSLVVIHGIEMPLFEEELRCKGELPSFYKCLKCGWRCEHSYHPEVELKFHYEHCHLK